jgi:transposase
VDGLPAHKKALVKDYVQSTAGRLTLHFLPGYAPDLNPDELVWSHVKRTGTARRPLQQGEKLQERIEKSCLLCSAIEHSCGHSFVPRPSPILRTAE